MDPTVSYTRNSTISRSSQPVAIVSVNPTMDPPQATGYTRARTYIQIDISHLVGAVQIVPSVGEQWMVINDNGIWKLERQLPHNLASGNSTMVEGQTTIGSRGPTEVNGSQINFNAPVRTMVSSTSARPEANSVPVGSQIYDKVLNQPLWSDGAIWRDAAGNSV